MLFSSELNVFYCKLYAGFIFTEVMCSIANCMLFLQKQKLYVFCCILCSIFPVAEVERLVIAALGSDVTEQVCEASCPALISTIPGGSLVAGFLCPQACKRSVAVLE